MKGLSVFLLWFLNCCVLLTLDIDAELGGGSFIFKPSIEKSDYMYTVSLSEY